MIAVNPDMIGRSRVFKLDVAAGVGDGERNSNDIIRQLIHLTVHIEPAGLKDRRYQQRVDPRLAGKLVAHDCE